MVYYLCITLFIRLQIFCYLLICVFIYIPLELIAGSPGAVSVSLSLCNLCLAEITAMHQALLINGITAAIVDMLAAGGLNTQANFNVDKFSFDDTRYQHSYMCSTIKRIIYMSMYASINYLKYQYTNIMNQRMFDSESRY